MKLAFGFTLLLAATPATGQVVNPLAVTTDPADRAVMAEAASALSSRTPDIARLDAVLAKLPRPTPLRGIVQTLRAAVLLKERKTPQDAGPAVAALEEALRLLPDDPRPKLVAAAIFTFTGAPQRAADLWMEASRVSPDAARMSDRYLMHALVGRLTDLGDRVRADRISARLGEIGFSAGLAPERSAMALAATREAVRGERESDALLGVTAINDPYDLVTLYIDRQYEKLWPRIAEWAGPDLAVQSSRYLEELRGDWSAAETFATARPYAQRLANMKAHDAVVGLFLPMFDQMQPDSTEEGPELLAPIVAHSLTILGRGTEARALLAKVAAVMPADNGGNELNITGAYITLAADQLDWPQVMVQADTFLARAKTLNTFINRSAVIRVQALRACALSRTGHLAQAQPPMAEVLLGGAWAPSAVMSMHLCLGDIAQARAFVITRLADEATRSWALRFVQPVRDKVFTPLDRLQDPVAQTVRTAPDVVAAANRVGRILPEPISATLPANFEPFRVKPGSQVLGPGAI